MRIVSKLLVATIMSLFAFNILSASFAVAASCEPADDFLGIPTWYKYLDGEEDPTRVDSDGNPLCSPVVDTENASSVLPIGLAVLEAGIRLAGLVAVVMIIVGSFRFMTSQGNSDNAAAARKTIINSLIGLVIVVIATSVVGFLGNTLADSAQADIKGWASIDNGVKNV